jgi:hypothetical protein
MGVTHDVLSVRGKAMRVPVVQIDGRVVAATGRFPRVAAVKDEEWYEGGRIGDLEAFRRSLAESGLKADVLSFACDLGQEHEFADAVRETDNVAVIDTSDFQSWWDGLPQEARKNTRRATKRGVRVEIVEYTDDLVRGIKAIYDEAPIRQGRRFWHYGKDVDTVRRENGTYLERSVFLGAFVEGQLVGFIKWVRVGQVARIMQILCLNAHQDKRPIIALIAKAAEVCHQQGSRYLVYGRYTYGNKGDSSIAEFKRRLGFTQLDFPRYYVALTLRGRIALQLGLHRGLLGVLPGWLLQRLIRWRAWWLARRDARGDVASDVEGTDSEKPATPSAARAPRAP